MLVISDFSGIIHCLDAKTGKLKPDGIIGIQVEKRPTSIASQFQAHLREFLAHFVETRHAKVLGLQ